VSMSSSTPPPPRSGNMRRKSAPPADEAGRAGARPTKEGARGVGTPKNDAFSGRGGASRPEMGQGARLREPLTEPRGMRIARGVVGFMMVLGIGGAVAWGARHYVKTSPRFAVSEIVTTGAKRRSPDELAAIAGIAKGQNVFSTDLDRARARLIADPWVNEATLARQLPGTIFLRVVEREAGGIVATNDGSAKAAGGETYVVTREGAIIKRLETGDPTDLPIVTGVVLQ